MLENKVVLIIQNHQLQSIWELGMKWGISVGGGGVAEGKCFGLRANKP